MDWVILRIRDGFGLLSVWMIDRLGDPSGKFAFSASLLCMVAMLNLVVWLVFPKLMGVMWNSLSCVVFFATPMPSVVPSESRGASTITAISSACSVVPVSRRAVTAKDGSQTTCASGVPQPLQTVVASDTSSTDSAISSLCGSVPSIKRVFQALLLRNYWAGGPELPPKPCNKKQAKIFPLLKLASFTRTV